MKDTSADLTLKFLQRLSKKLSTRSQFRNDEYRCDICKVDNKLHITFSHSNELFYMNSNRKVKLPALYVVALNYLNDCTIIDHNTILTEHNLIPGSYIYKFSNKRLVRRWTRITK